MDDLTAVERRIAALKAELERLAITRQTILSLRAGTDISLDEVPDAAATGDLAGASYVDAATAVLRDAGGGPLHYAEITKQAIRRGFRGKEGELPGDDRFRRRMGESAVFQKDGEGNYWLRRQ